jgi:steroid delta-isomerase-like uncharacterized protein
MYSQISKISIACIVLVALTSIFQTATANTEANKAVSRRDFEEAMNQGKLEVYDEIVAPEVVLHTTSGDFTGIEGFKAVASMYLIAFPDFHLTIEDMVAEGDLVCTRFTNTGTHQGELMGIPATGASIVVTGMAIHRITDGRIQEAWLSADALGMMQQLGVMPPTRETYTWGEPSAITGDPGDPETNKALLRRLFDEAFKGNLDIIDELMPADYVFHDPVSPVEVRGPEDYKQHFAMYATAFPDIQLTTEDMIAEGDKVTVRWTLTGTHNGELMGIPPTGRRITMTGINIYRIADGKFVETWPSYDALGMIQQLTTPEWPLEGAWIATVPTPLGNIIFKGIWAAQDATKTQFTGEFEQINTYPVLIDVYPDAEEVKFAGGSAVKTGLNKYEMTSLEYFTRTAGASLEEIVGIGIVTGTIELVGPDLHQGQGTGAYYMAAQDADQDGFPDEGEEPVLCMPWGWTAKRLTSMPACVPTPMPE